MFGLRATEPEIGSNSMMDRSCLQNHFYIDEGKAYYGDLEGIAPITLWIWLEYWFELEVVVTISPVVAT